MNNTLWKPAWASIVLIACFCACDSIHAQKRQAVSKTDFAQSSPEDAVPGTDTAYFASGCFWCTEAIFESLKGVQEAIAGYAGGHTSHPTYEESNTGKTGHAESVEIIYDPAVISFSRLVDVYFGSQDPTQVNGQGPDEGSQYRSIIFYKNQAEKNIIEEKKTQLAEQLHATVAAEVMPFNKFWRAEAYHQHYEQEHPENPYIQNVSLPRINRFKEKFPELLKDGSALTDTK